MPRNKRRRRIMFKPGVYYFKPRGVPMKDLEEVVLCRDELEALKLKFVNELAQIDAANKMNVSQPTFHRILNSACKIIAAGICDGKAIRIED